MSRTTDELLTVLDNLTESWKTLGQPSQHQVQREAMRELRANLAETAPKSAQKGRR